MNYLEEVCASVLLPHGPLFMVKLVVGLLPFFIAWCKTMWHIQLGVDQRGAWYVTLPLRFSNSSPNTLILPLFWEHYFYQHEAYCVLWRLAENSCMAYSVIKS